MFRSHMGAGKMMTDHVVNQRTLLEGQSDFVACAGVEGQDAPPCEKDSVKALRAENEHLRQLLYHQASYAKQRDFKRWMAYVGNVSTSAVAKAVNESANVLTIDRNRSATYKLQPQFIFRLMYSIIEQAIGEQECRWNDRPNGCSKLKWLWRNNLLFMAPFAIYCIRAMFSEMFKADKQATIQLFKALEKSASSKSQNP